MSTPERLSAACWGWMKSSPNQNYIDGTYIDLLSDCIECGEDIPARNGLTRSLKGAKLSLDLRVTPEEYVTHGPHACAPALLTTKKVFMRNVCGELLWMTGFGRKVLPSGRTVDTNIATLHELGGGKIWDDDAAKARERGYPYAEGELGRIYGWMWCNYGVRPNPDGTCPNMTSGTHQLLAAEKLLKSNPYSRQNVVSAFDPERLQALPSCHSFFQLLGAPPDDQTPAGSKGYLDLTLYMRSCDVGLGLPFNMFSYSILLAVYAKSAGLTPRELIIDFGDLHVYHDHFEGLISQMKNPSHPRGVFKLPDEISCVSDLWKPEVTADTLMNAADAANVYYENCGPPVRMPLST